MEPNTASTSGTEFAAIAVNASRTRRFLGRLPPAASRPTLWRSARGRGGAATPSPIPPGSARCQQRSVIFLRKGAEGGSSRARNDISRRTTAAWWKGLCADSEEKRGPVSDINAVEVDSQSEKALDPKRPIREADISGESRGGNSGHRTADKPQAMTERALFHALRRPC